MAGVSTWISAVADNHFMVLIADYGSVVAVKYRNGLLADSVVD